MARTTDGLGAPLDPAALYYVQDKRIIVGNCALWWGINAAGYVCDLDAAGKYTGEYCAALRETDIPWPVAHVEARTVRHVRVDSIGVGLYGPPKPTNESNTGQVPSNNGR